MDGRVDFVDGDGERDRKIYRERYEEIRSSR